MDQTKLREIRNSIIEEIEAVEEQILEMEDKKSDLECDLYRCNLQLSDIIKAVDRKRWEGKL